MANPRQITLPELGRFSIDGDNRLYWDGRIIQTESIVVLSGRQNAWAIVVAIATVISAIAGGIYTWVYVNQTTRPGSPTVSQQMAQPINKQSSVAIVP